MFGIMNPMNLDRIQSALGDAALDGCFLYDHHHRGPLARRNFRS